MSRPEEHSDDLVGTQPALPARQNPSAADAPTSNGEPARDSTKGTAATQFSQAAPVGKTRTADPQSAQPRPLPAIAGYRVLGELGRGGMGVVYKAEQLALGRIVALKVLTTGVHAGPAELARFRREAESAARLSHPSIVQVYEVGEAGGCPFFSLEFVAGGTLSEKLRGQPQSPQESARLMVTIARGVQLAHDQQIIHRDLKPANVLLTLQGEPKIADFGLAKRLAGASQTQTGEVMGTPSYMAPEQASGATKSIGPACDVYSLGAILYEMLTGRPPFHDQDPVETILQVISDEPVSVRRLTPSTPRDLDTICHKCLEKQPTKRYATASELADDLDRFLENQPVQARPTPAWERIVKWTRRRPAVAALIGVIVLSVITIFCYGFWKNRQLAAQRDRALTNFDLAIENTSRRIQHAGRSTDELLRDELKFLATIREQTGNEAEVRYERAKAARLSGDILRKLGEAKSAAAAYEAALAELDALMGDDSENLVYPRDRAGVLNGRGQLQADEGKLEVAVQDYESAIALFTRLHEREGQETDALKQRAAVTGNLILALNRMGRIKEAISRQETLLQLWKELLAVDPNDPSCRRDYAIAQGNLAAVLLRTKPHEAEKLLVGALRESEQLPARVKSEQLVREFIAASHTNLATVLAKRSALAEAQAEYQKGLEIMQHLVATYPDVIRYEQGVADIHNNQAFLLAGSGKFKEAIIDMDAAAKIYASLAATHPESAQLKAEKQRLEGLVKELEESAKAGMP